jgi:signal recognition particle subunit SRP54
VSDVNQLVDRFFEARKMMMSMAKGGGVPGMPGMPGIGGGKRAKARQAPKKGKAKRGSGNPAKRAQQQAAEARRAEAGRAEAGNGANPFGLPADDGGAGDEEFQLPDEFSKYLPKQ